MQENKQIKSKIKRNISLYLSKKGVSDYEFYKKSGITRGVLTQQNGISEDNIARFLAYAPDVNSEWLLTGHGDMFKTKRTSEESPSHKEDTSDDKVTDIFPHGQGNSQYNNDILIELLREKDETIREQAKEIGRLEARIEELERRKGNDAGHARSSGIADAG